VRTDVGKSANIGMLPPWMRFAPRVLLGTYATEVADALDDEHGRGISRPEAGDRPASPAAPTGPALDPLGNGRIPQNPPVIPTGKDDSKAASLAGLALLAGFAFLVMGYHPGLEDDAFYLAAIKRNLNPALFPHDADFLRLQFQATIFDKLIALSVRWTHVPLAWVALLWQLAAIFVILNSCWRISRRCFSERPAQWAAVTMIAVLLPLPVSGTAINIADQHLHPRTLATAAILAAIVAVMDQRRWLAGVLLAIAFAVHAIMASFGISACAFLFWSQFSSLPQRRSSKPIAGLILFPLGWIFEPASDAWRRAAATCSFYYLARWHWYEWLGNFCAAGAAVWLPAILAASRRSWLLPNPAVAGVKSPLLWRLSNYSGADHQPFARSRASAAV
jgi:hypothetical protein